MRRHRRAWREVNTKIASRRGVYGIRAVQSLYKDFPGVTSFLRGSVVRQRSRPTCRASRGNRSSPRGSFLGGGLLLVKFAACLFADEIERSPAAFDRICGREFRESNVNYRIFDHLFLHIAL